MHVQHMLFLINISSHSHRTVPWGRHVCAAPPWGLAMALWLRSLSFNTTPLCGCDGQSVEMLGA